MPSATASREGRGRSYRSCCTTTGTSWTKVASGQYGLGTEPVQQISSRRPWRPVAADAGCRRPEIIYDSLLPTAISARSAPAAGEQDLGLRGLSDPGHPQMFFAGGFTHAYGHPGTERGRGHPRYRPLITSGAWYINRYQAPRSGPSPGNFSYAAVRFSYRNRTNFSLLAGCHGRLAFLGVAADGRRHIIAIGGGMLMPEDRVPVHLDYALQLTGRREPRLCALQYSVRGRPPVGGFLLRQVRRSPGAGQPSGAVPDAECGAIPRTCCSLRT